MFGAGDAAEVGVDHRAFVGAPVAVRVAAVEQVRGRDYQQAVAGDGQGPGQDQPFQELRALVHAPVPIRVYEHGHRTQWLLLAGAIHVGHVGTHFRHPQLPVTVEGDGHRIVNQGLSCHQLDAQARGYLKGGRLCSGAEGRGGGDSQVRG